MVSPKVAVVTGASRGIGKGIAIALGGAGYTVYLTGRAGSEDVASTPLQSAADAVTNEGGEGIPVVCDHGDDAQVRALFDRIEAEQEGLDLLVNNATCLPRALVAQGGFWERSLELADMFNVGLRSAYVASAMAVPLMLDRPQALIASVSFFGAVTYFHGPAYGAQKAGLDKMMADMALELKPLGIAALSVWPGFVKTEMVLQRWSGTPEGEERLRTYESPALTGHVVTTLARDPELMSYAGQQVIVAEYATLHDIREPDGSQPVSLREKMGDPRPFHMTHSI
ncbi:SDR family NAD(P)-dependent oxidoreductase [Sphingobium sp. JS3065]|uniref:SDR family NAD(P)-dependent oxidoreductase n=1 Tax=Sphingobium sp. JS3065 TaxID=2970925 RepID=UPI002263F918|nr:SDR family NAD(P)-dependent oxidoreductase [Sphingobium sp. JS3065]UZW57504.1 SDR family NAD(P)-dependent oxidoreductase [Sphingobium sp. JS3065]